MTKAKLKQNLSHRKCGKIKSLEDAELTPEIRTTQSQILIYTIDADVICSKGRVAERRTWARHENEPK